MKRIIYIMMCVFAAAYAAAQEPVSLSLSPAEERFAFFTATADRSSSRALTDNPAWLATKQFVGDTTALQGLVYACMAGSDADGDFMHYEGTGATDWRIGASGTYVTPHSGTLSGSIQYVRGKHRNIGWSAMRMPELYLPYISTDSCGGDFKFDSYYAEGAYSFSINTWTLGVRMSFYGEQSWRLTDPRALNNTTWLRFTAGATKQLGQHLVMLSAGYGRNKQHEQLRYWRPGQQDRFFVCYGFGLYDTRQSAVSFGKARMFYIDEFTARLQYLSPASKALRLHASLGYTRHSMATEESDIYNLYESRTGIIEPQMVLAWQPDERWTVTLGASASIEARKGYENIIEEYLANADYNSYDFRTIDSQQNYVRDVNTADVSLSVSRQFGRLSLTVLGGMSANGYEEKYLGGVYSIKVNASMPYVGLETGWQTGRRDRLGASLRYGKSTVGSHHYDVLMQNTKVKHLDFQQAFAPYAYRAADLTKFALSLSWEHSLAHLAVGLSASYYSASGNRLADAVYTGTIGYASTAPMISAQPDVHRERRGSLAAYVKF
ncbi:MAG: hypothetical protein IKQ68_03180 [Prevotella sp.]|nr:hypothetical protein [Prevotella sp.]